MSIQVVTDSMFLCAFDRTTGTDNVHSHEWPSYMALVASPLINLVCLAILTPSCKHC